MVVFFRWVLFVCLPALLLGAAGCLLTGDRWGALLAGVYPVWLVIRLFLTGTSLQSALPPRVGSGGRFEELVSPQVFLEVVREPAAWAMVTRAPWGSPRILLTEGLLHIKSTEEICTVVRDLETRAFEPGLSLRTFAASLGVGPRLKEWQLTRLPLSVHGRKQSVFAVAGQLVGWSWIRFMERLLGAPILGGKDRLAIHY